MHILAWTAFHSTDGNYEKPSHTATTKINLSETANVQIPTKPSPLTTVPFLRTWAGLRPCSRSEVNQQHQKVTQTQEPSITMILARFTSPAWEWMNFLTVFRKPSRHIFNFIHRISPREISHISNYLDRLSTFCSDFSFLPTTNQVHIWVHEAQEGLHAVAFLRSFHCYSRNAEEEAKFCPVPGLARGALAGRGW